MDTYKLDTSSLIGSLGQIRELEMASIISPCQIQIFNEMQRNLIALFKFVR